MRTHQLVVALCLLFASLGSRSAAAQQEAVKLVTIESGDLPIVLSAPHGGREAIPGVRARKGEGVDLFNPRSDSFTNQLTVKLADALEKKLGSRPYTVIARFHRKYVDANRPRKLAYESEEVKAVYDTYHHAVAEARRDVMRRWGHGILLDIHGQGAEPQAIFRGTQNGKTVSHLINRFGRDAVAGKNSLFGRLAQHGFEVYPAIDSEDPEHVRYDGGHIVVTYGSGAGGTLDAIQLELGRSLRSPDVNTTTAEKLASAITAFANGYLPKAEQVPDGLIFSDNFSDGNHDGWFEVHDEVSNLSVKSKSGQLSSFPELNFATSDTSSLRSFATHFPKVKLKRAGDFVTLQFDARHNHAGFLNRGFRFGLFDSDESG
jgi:N-formylglutamate amidohydrolase